MKKAKVKVSWINGRMNKNLSKWYGLGMMVTLFAWMAHKSEEGIE